MTTRNVVLHADIVQEIVDDPKQLQALAERGHTQGIVWGYVITIPGETTYVGGDCFLSPREARKAMVEKLIELTP